jgi:hypothetical protein
MGFLPDYEDDIFISYAHNDNQPLIEGQPGWVDTFHKALERRLQVHLGAKPSIWRDPRLQGNEYFADTLVEQIPKVAILISLLSPSYNNSEWCRREMQMFHRIAPTPVAFAWATKHASSKLKRFTCHSRSIRPNCKG